MLQSLSKKLSRLVLLMQLGSKPNDRPLKLGSSLYIWAEALEWKSEALQSAGRRLFALPSPYCTNFLTRAILSEQWWQQVKLGWCWCAVHIVCQRNVLNKTVYCNCPAIGLRQQLLCASFFSTVSWSFLTRLQLLPLQCQRFCPRQCLKSAVWAWCVAATLYITI